MVLPPSCLQACSAGGVSVGEIFLCWKNSSILPPTRSSIGPPANQRLRFSGSVRYDQRRSMGPGSVRMMRISPGAGNWARSSLFFMIFLSEGCVCQSGRILHDLVVVGLQAGVSGPERWGRGVVEQGEQHQKVSVPAACVTGEKREVVAAATMGEDQQHLVILR